MFGWGVGGGKPNEQKSHRFKGRPWKFMEACLDRSHGEQLGQLSNITAGSLISPTQFFTPYFSNKKAVKPPLPPPTAGGPGCHLEPRLHVIIQPPLKCFLADYSRRCLYRCGTDLQTAQ